MPLLTLLLALSSSLLLLLVPSASGLRCWQCASVGGRRCPDAAEPVDSLTHDSCITWRLGNGSVILQNAVIFEKECTPSKVEFWTNFINMYYSSKGSEVRCCNADGCNTGGGSGSGAGGGGGFFQVGDSTRLGADKWFFHSLLLWRLLFDKQTILYFVFFILVNSVLADFFSPLCFYGGCCFNDTYANYFV